MTAGGFDELGERGMCVGEITELVDEQTKTMPNRLKSNLVKIEFVPMPQMQFEIKEIDISNKTSTMEIINELHLENNIYRIILTGTRNVDVEKLKDETKTTCDTVCEIIDNTKTQYNLEEIANEKNLKGVFTRKMLEELKKHPEDEEKIMKAIEVVYSNL